MKKFMGLLLVATISITFLADDFSAIEVSAAQEQTASVEQVAEEQTAKDETTEEQVAEEQTAKEETTEEQMTEKARESEGAEQMLGGWTNQEDTQNSAIPKEAFKALEEAAMLEGQGFEPIALLSQQVVAGMNYAFLCKDTLTAAKSGVTYKYIEIYKPLDDSAKLTLISDFDIGKIRQNALMAEEVYAILEGLPEEKLNYIMDVVAGTDNEHLGMDMLILVGILFSDNEDTKILMAEALANVLAVAKANKAAEEKAHSSEETGIVQDNKVYEMVVKSIFAREATHCSKAAKHAISAILMAVFDDLARAQATIETYKTQKDDAAEEGVLAGGWALNADIVKMSEISEGEREPFDKAIDGLLGIKYEPIALLGKQVVSGTNYAYLIQATTVTVKPVKYLAVMYVYVNLEGKAKLMDIVPFTSGELVSN